MAHTLRGPSFVQRGSVTGGRRKAWPYRTDTVAVRFFRVVRPRRSRCPPTFTCMVPATGCCCMVAHSREVPSSNFRSCRARTKKPMFCSSQARMAVHAITTCSQPRLHPLLPARPVVRPRDSGRSARLGPSDTLVATLGSSPVRPSDCWAGAGGGKTVEGAGCVWANEQHRCFPIRPAPADEGGGKKRQRDRPASCRQCAAERRAKP